MAWQRLLLACLCVLATTMAAAETPQAGAPAPDFALRDGTGKLRQLADWRGQWLVLYFYPKDDTPGCTTEAQRFRDSHAEFAALGAQVAGVSLDDASSHQAFAREQRLNFPLLVDEGGKTARTYGALTNLGIAKFAKRHTFLIDPDGRIAKVYRDVEPSSHATELLADIRLFKRN
jgi:peroxiredoxin Q/BCP